MAVADTTTAQVLNAPVPSTTLPAGLSSEQSLQANAHTAAANEFANVNEQQTPRSEEMDLNDNADNATPDEEDAEEENDDDDDDDGDDGAFGEISEQDEEEDNEEDEDADAVEEEEEEENTTSKNASDLQGQSSARPSASNGYTSSEHLHRKRRDSHDVAFDAEMDPDLYGLRRSVGLNKFLKRSGLWKQPLIFTLYALTEPLCSI